jgi:hypothetical protein
MKICPVTKIGEGEKLMEMKKKNVVPEMICRKIESRGHAI